MNFRPKCIKGLPDLKGADLAAFLKAVAWAHGRLAEGDAKKAARRGKEVLELASAYANIEHSVFNKMISLELSICSNNERADTYKEDSYTCSNCGWQGTGGEAEQGEMFDFGFELDCPKCHQRFPGLIPFKII